MPVLTPQQRNTLESAVKQARKLSESGARNALKAIAVDNPEPFPHMNPEQRSLRNRLRTKARLLGDELPSSGHQQIDHLTYELAYEYWHKMLFAKFLEANGLLMHPDGVSITMEECEELAKEAGYIDKWDTAASFASKMLPAIFRSEDPLMQMSFAPNDRIKLEEIIDGLDNYIFTANDALGWVYQFWQSEAKEAINKSGDKIDGEKLPAVTQLFTESYMVHFLIDNTIGAWWVSRNPGLKTPLNFEFLRLLDDGTPAAGKFEGWPEKTAEITALDPCMGSGHFVVSLFTVLANLRMLEEGLSKEEATDQVITENLHGLELDPRCTQIAAFNLALTAWKFCGKYKVLPEMNLACSGIAPKGKKEDWIKLVGKVSDQVLKARMENGMSQLYDYFQLAPELGSLLDPTTLKSDAFTTSFEQLQPLLLKALEYEVDKDLIERGVIAAGIAKAGAILSKNFHLSITNVPFLGSNRMSPFVKLYYEREYSDAKYDLCTVFLKKLLDGLKFKNSYAAIVTLNSWLTLKSYESLRKTSLKNFNIGLIADLGTRAFTQIGGEVVKVCLSVISKKRNSKNYISFIDLTEFRSTKEKEIKLRESSIFSISQESIFENPQTIITKNIINSKSLLESYAFSPRGIVTGDSDKWLRYIWEIDRISNRWKLIQIAVNLHTFFGGNTCLIDWTTEGVGMLRPGIENKALGRKGISVSRQSSLSSSIYQGGFYDQNSAAIVPFDEKNLIALWCFCESDTFAQAVRKIDKKIGVTPATLLKVPFDVKHWQQVANEKYPTGLPEPYSDDPTQWIFHGNPCKTINPLQVALARLLRYRWPAEVDTELELADEARELIAVIKKFDYISDNDGIICITSVNTEETAANRLRNYLKEVLSNEWNNNTLNQMLAIENSKSANLENWLRNEFFIQHCKVFNNRPFIWHIWDGRNDGFSALVNYHKLTKENLSKLIYTYLGDWIHMCESKKKSGESGAEGLLSAALKLKEKLELILEGETPYDVFVRWKPLDQQPIGWDPDLNDGIRLNIRPFIVADVLRKKPNIKWGIDRGKNPPGSPWGEIRDNDRHLTLAEKKAVREKSK